MNSHNNTQDHSGDAGLASRAHDALKSPDADAAQMSANLGPNTGGAGADGAQPPAQVTEGGFQSKVNNALSGSGGVDRVQGHTERQGIAGAEAQMDQAQDALNSR